MIKFIDPDHAFYRPLWVRLLIVTFCAAAYLAFVYGLGLALP